MAVVGIAFGTLGRTIGAGSRFASVFAAGYGGMVIEMTVVGVAVACVAFGAVSVDIAGASPDTTGIAFVDEGYA